MKKVLFFALSMLIVANTYLFATSGYEIKPHVGSADFDRLKALAGTWKGTSIEMNGVKSDAAVEDSVTSNGSAVVEKLFSGTPHEMVTIYYDQKGKPSMTHYCAIGNRPQMNLASSSATEMKFDFSQTSAIDPAKEDHMHSLTLTFDGKDKLVQTWKFFKNGAEAGSTVIALARNSK